MSAWAHTLAESGWMQKASVSRCLWQLVDADSPYWLQMDMNVSLTAVGLLWNASDLISKLHSKTTPEAGAGIDSKPVTAHTLKIDAVQFEELIRQLFGALQVSLTSLPLDCLARSACMSECQTACRRRTPVIPGAIDGPLTSIFLP